eukprot:scaffold167_cov110-Cylindrotheca_fusiformis.AAC.28
MKETKKRKNSEAEKVDPRFFIYTSKTKDADIPRKTLTHVRVDSSVREIPERAFQYCIALAHVQLPETLTRIRGEAFCYCFDLKCVQVVSRNAETSSIDPNLEDGTIVFPAKAKLQIDEKAFLSCESLRKVSVGSVSTILGNGGLSFIGGLISVELPEGLQVIETRLFLFCASLTKVNIPTSVIKIGEEAFSLCQNLASIDLPHGLVEIGVRSFEKCYSIETLHIPSTVSSIGREAFGNCRHLKHIELPPTLKAIESDMFFECRSLEYIDIPSTVSIIEGGVFYSCSHLTHIRFPPSVKRIAPGAISQCLRLMSIEVPEGVLYDIDLSSHCNFLVNFAGAVHISGIFHYSKFACVVDGYDDLVLRLKHRFDNCPLVKLCYYQSYHSSEDAMQQLRSLMEEDPLAATNQTDAFGMTPLHVLSLAQTPNLDMLLALMKEGNMDHMVQSTDAFGSTPMDYLCLNSMPNATEVIRRVLQTRFDYVLGLERSGIPETMRQAVDDALEMVREKKKVEKVYFKLQKYEQRMKSLSLVELRLWKTKIDEVSSKEHTVDRESCRINSGASVVIPHVLPFLDMLDVSIDG